MREREPDPEAISRDCALADLTADTGQIDALLVLARYLIFRIVRLGEKPERRGFDEATERAAARNYLDAVPPSVPDRRWLEAVLRASARPSSRTLVSRLNAAASAAARRGHAFGAYALRHAAWRLARRNGWHAEAGRTARAIAAAGSGTRARRLWSRRARVHEARARA